MQQDTGHYLGSSYKNWDPVHIPIQQILFRTTKNWPEGHAKAVFQIVWNRYCDWKMAAFWWSSKRLSSNLKVTILTMFMLSVPLLSVGSFALQSPYLLCITTKSTTPCNIRLYIHKIAPLMQQSIKLWTQKSKSTRFRQNSEIQCGKLCKKVSSIAGDVTCRRISPIFVRRREDSVLGFPSWRWHTGQGCVRCCFRV